MICFGKNKRISLTNKQIQDFYVNEHIIYFKIPDISNIIVFGVHHVERNTQETIAGRVFSETGHF